MGTESFGKVEVQTSDRKLISNFSRIRLTRCSAVPVHVSPVLRGISRKSAWDRKIKVVKVGGAASENDTYAGVKEAVRASLRYLC